MSFKLRRTLAYIFDIMAISLIAGALSMSALNPNIDKIEDLNTEYNEKVEQLNENIANLDSEKDTLKITELSEDFYNYYKGFLYKQTKLSLYEGIITITFIILYFVIFAYFFDGQTVGKRIMKIKIVNKNGSKIRFTALILRTIILYGVLITVLNIILSYVLLSNDFSTMYNLLYYVSLTIEIAIFSMFLIRKDCRGLHDVISGTKVIDLKEN